MSRLGALAAKVGGQAVPRPFGPVIEEIVRELLLIQDEQLQLLRQLQQDVQGLRQDVDRLLRAHWNAGRGFLERAKIPGRFPEEQRRDLRKASDEFIRAAGVYSQSSLVRAVIYAQLSITLALLDDTEAAKYYARRAWRGGVRCLYREVRLANDYLSGHPKRRFLLFSSQEYRVLPVRSSEQLSRISRLVAQLREVVVQLTPASPASFSRSSRRPVDCHPHYSLTGSIDDRIYVERAYSWECIDSRALRIGECAARHGLAGRVYGRALAKDERLCAGLIVPIGDFGSSQAFRNDVQNHFRWGIDVQDWSRRELEPYEAIA